MIEDSAQDSGISEQLVSAKCPVHTGHNSKAEDFALTFPNRELPVLNKGIGQQPIKDVREKK